MSAEARAALGQLGAGMVTSDAMAPATAPLPADDQRRINSVDEGVAALIADGWPAETRPQRRRLRAMVTKAMKRHHRAGAVKASSK